MFFPRHGADAAALADGDESDPRSLARLMRRMGRELREEPGEGGVAEEAGLKEPPAG